MHLEAEAALRIWTLLDDAYYGPVKAVKIRCTDLGLPMLTSPRLRMEAALALQEILTEFWRARACGLAVAGDAFNPLTDHIKPVILGGPDVTVRVIRAALLPQHIDPKSMPFVRVGLAGEYIVQNNADAVAHAQECICEDITNAVKHNELAPWVIVAGAPNATIENVPEFLRESAVNADLGEEGESDADTKDHEGD